MNSHPIRAAVERAIRPGCFFLAPPGRLRIEHVVGERVPWEIFRGHLLDPAHTRESVQFEAWNIFLDDDRAIAAAPLISIKWQASLGRVYVTRQILTHGFEAYEDTPGVILSRPVHKWTAELVGTIDPERFPDGLAAEVGVQVFLAVIGTSRLPITSLESPLPAFSLGQLCYVPRPSEADEPWTDPIAFLRAVLDGECKTIEQAKVLETAFRATPAKGLPALVSALQHCADRGFVNSDFLTGLFRAVFNNAALSPYTEFADRMIAVLLELAAAERLGATAVADVFSYLLRHLCRHLTAFDLTLFHNFGANYPDALFLDSLLTAYLRLIDEHPDLFSSTPDDAVAVARQKRSRRRALRQACLARKQYEGHRVPDAPTSMGENARVLPAPFARVPEQQILQTGKRRRTLFDGQPLEGRLSETGRRALEESVADLKQAVELDELGMAQFLDRPLGVFKEPGEVDRTPLLAYEAFSRSIVKRRLSQLKTEGWITNEQREQYATALQESSTGGVAAGSVCAADRPGVVSLADARKVATDFVLVRTTRGSLDGLLADYDLQPLARASGEIVEWLESAASILLVQDTPPGESSRRATLKFYDERANLRLELGFSVGPDRMIRYHERGGVELVDRLQVLRIAEAVGGGEWTMRDVRELSLWLELC